ncbi:MFS transporter [Alicyclobacillus ferrooxydans]|uniref:MFS transporter n=1 Tax=Alicyclobacillus ferrooxydans TaxID=471514 RepID=A0A0P9EI99_9BACL|nr:MFS transporter [Alicyclobacillus ferrooxydans]
MTDFVQKRRNLVLITVALGILLNPLNSSMISVAVARLQQVFSLSFSQVSWLISTYYLASAIAQPVMGKVADSVGRKRVFIIGLILVTVTSVTAPFAPTFAWLIALRLVQSIGSGALFPAGMAMVRQWVTERQSQAIAFLGIFSSGAAAFGPSIGGFAMHFGDWPALFMINLPIILVGILMAIFLLPPDKFDNSAEARSSGLKALFGQLDLLGIGFFAAMIILVLVFLLSISQHAIWWTGIVGILLLAAFVWQELRVARPFIDLRMFKENMSFTWVEIQFVTVNIIFYCIFFGIPDYLQEARHFDAQVTGLLMLCIAGSSVIVSPLTGMWVEKSGSRPPLLLAGLCLTVGPILFLTITLHSSILWMSVVFFILGLSNGLNNIGLQTALFAASPAKMMGVASGLFMMARYMGTILSTVFLGFVFSRAIGTPELHTLGIALAIMGLLVIAMSLRLPKGRHGTA